MLVYVYFYNLRSQLLAFFKIITTVVLGPFGHGRKCSTTELESPNFSQLTLLKTLKNNSQCINLRIRLGKAHVEGSMQELQR